MAKFISGKNGADIAMSMRHKDPQADAGIDLVAVEDTKDHPAHLCYSSQVLCRRLQKSARTTALIHF
jgi:hypothetical protein